MVRAPPKTWDRSTDVVVIGSGTGLAAALAASEGGTEVLVLEKSPYIGGTTAISGGGSWAPNSPQVEAAVGETSREALMTYLKRITQGLTPVEKLERYIDAHEDVFRFIEAKSPVEFVFAGGPPDYHAEFEGGEPEGRHLVPDLYDGDRLGDRLDDLRPSKHYPLPVTFEDIETVGSSTVFSTRGDRSELEERKENNMLGTGSALIGGLYEALLERGVSFEREAPAIDLVQDGDRVVGVVADVDSDETLIEAGAVVVAAGGLEWDEEMREQFLRGPLTAPASPPYNEGDGIEMGAAAGAKLGNMAHAFWFPTVTIEDDSWEDGSDFNKLAVSRQLPGAIVVNEAGERFADETANYNDFGTTLHEFDPTAFEYENLPAYQVMDHGFRQEYAMEGPVMPDDDLPERVTKADSLQTLAEKLDVDPSGLRATVETFNEHAADGEDPVHNAGEIPYARKKGDPEAPHPNLAPLDQPPFYAFELQPGAIGTKGGLVTSVDAEVLDWDEQPISGLYASSNSAAHVMGLGYAGGGGTIGPNLVFGHIAGEQAAAFVVGTSQ